MRSPCSIAALSFGARGGRDREAEDVTSSSGSTSRLVFAFDTEIPTVSIPSEFPLNTFSRSTPVPGPSVQLAIELASLIMPMSLVKSKSLLLGQELD